MDENLSYDYMIGDSILVKKEFADIMKKVLLNIVLCRISCFEIYSQSYCFTDSLIAAFSSDTVYNGQDSFHFVETSTEVAAETIRIKESGIGIG